jgi:hypothetical protein
VKELRRQIKAMQQQQQQNQLPQPQSQHEDITQKLLKYAELKNQGILSEGEVQFSPQIQE